MKVAIISDIHGNIEALKATLLEIEKIGAKKILCLGDYVGYYYHPDQVIRVLKRHSAEFIKGNHEVILKDYLNGINVEKVDTKYGIGHALCKEKLTEEEFEFLYTLPLSKTIELKGVKIQMNHGSPWNYDTYIYPDTDHEIKEKCFEGGHDFVFIGHSHHSFIFESENGTLVNVGSVGQNRKKGGVAEWCLLDLSTRTVEIKQTAYDTTSLKNELIEKGFEESYSFQILNRNA